MTSTLGNVLQEIVCQLAGFLAVLLAASALHKAFTPGASVPAVRNLTRLPRALAPLALGLAASIELLAAAGLLMDAWRGSAALLALALLAIYLGLLGRALRGGQRAMDCGCHFGASSRGLGFYELARNALLIVLAGVVAAAGRSGLAGTIEPRHLLAGAAAFALYLAVESVAALQPLRRAS